MTHFNNRAKTTKEPDAAHFSREKPPFGRIFGDVARVFQDTRWTLIQRASSPDRRTRERAWDEFYGLYREPLIWYIRSLGWTESDSDDHLQSFLAKLAEREWLSDAGRDQIKLRTFLLLRLKRHLNDIRKRESAAKRGGGVAHAEEPFDETLFDSGAASPGDEVQQEFDQRWAQVMLDRALVRLREEAKGRGNLEVFEVLSSQLTDESPKQLRQAAERLGRSEGAVRMILQRQRKRLGVVLREEVEGTLSPGTDVNEEVRYLAEIVA